MIDFRNDRTFVFPRLKGRSERASGYTFSDVHAGKEKHLKPITKTIVDRAENQHR
jgi:hypothetical protein